MQGQFEVELSHQVITEAPLVCNPVAILALQGRLGVDDEC